MHIRRKRTRELPYLVSVFRLAEIRGLCVDFWWILFLEICRFRGKTETVQSSPIPGILSDFSVNQLNLTIFAQNSGHNPRIFRNRPNFLICKLKISLIIKYRSFDKRKTSNDMVWTSPKVWIPGYLWWLNICFCVANICSWHLYITWYYGRNHCVWWMWLK